MVNLINFPNFAFFGTDEFAVMVLDELKKADCRPELIVTIPDKPRGKYLQLTPPPVKLWAENNGTPCIQPDNLKTIPYKLEAIPYKLFLVASYGKLIPAAVLDLPKHGTLNLHPSLLPAYRGPTPIQSAILDGITETGVTLMLLDEKLDHGPSLKMESVKLKTQNFIELRDQLAKLGAKLFLDTAVRFVEGGIKSAPQDHDRATYTKKIKKEDGLIDLAENPIINYRKFLAHYGSVGTYFFVERHGRKVRVIITAAYLTDNQLVIEKVKPEGKREMAYADFQRGFKSR